jgi:hypothetical protein
VLPDFRLFRSRELCFPSDDATRRGCDFNRSTDDAPHPKSNTHSTHICVTGGQSHPNPFANEDTHTHQDTHPNHYQTANRYIRPDHYTTPHSHSHSNHTEPGDSVHSDLPG